MTISQRLIDKASPYNGIALHRWYGFRQALRCCFSLTLEYRKLVFKEPRKIASSDILCRVSRVDITSTEFLDSCYSIIPLLCHSISMQKCVVSLVLLACCVYMFLTYSKGSLAPKQYCSRLWNSNKRNLLVLVVRCYWDSS